MGPEYKGSGETSTPLILHLEVERLLMQDRMAINPFCYHSDFSLHPHLALLLADPNQTTTDVNRTKWIIVHYKSKFDMQSSCKNIIVIISCALMTSCTADVQLPRVCAFACLLLLTTGRAASFVRATPYKCMLNEIQ